MLSIFAPIQKSYYSKILKRVCMSKYKRETIDVYEMADVDVYREVIAFMAVNSYHFDQCVEPIRIEGKKEDS
jgi:hypothetical protein